MSKKNKDNRPEARLPKGMRDIGPNEIRGMTRMLAQIREVYENYGFEPLETPAFEYTDALGKFLPDQDRPNAGVFSFKDEDEEWVSLRYDLTAPLARYVAENFEKLPKPFRRYAYGPVWRNEKPGPGRFRQFMQFDADTVGAESVAADAEICMLAADTLERLGIPRGSYVIKVNNRKIMDGILESSGLGGDANAERRLIVMRAFDKIDRLGAEGTRQLLGKGRRDESGDFTKGAELSEQQIDRLLGLFELSDTDQPGEQSQEFVTIGGSGSFGTEKASDAGQSRDMEQVGTSSYVSNKFTLEYWEKCIGNSAVGLEGIKELREFNSLCEAAVYGSKRIRLDSSIVRGLEYYTGLVFEAELTFESYYNDGKPVRFGSVGGGGRYDGLVERFTGQKTPATGFSIGVSRLYAALAHLGKLEADKAAGPVVVLVMDKARLAETQKLAQTLREAGIRAEMYLGTSGMKAQMKYADKRGAPAVIIQGGDELAKGEVTIKDLIEGAKAAAAIKDNAEWKAARPAQLSVSVDQMVATVRDILARHRDAKS